MMRAMSVVGPLMRVLVALSKFPEKAATYFLLAVLSGLLVGVSCLCGECIATRMIAPPLPPPPPPPPPLSTAGSSTKVRNVQVDSRPWRIQG